MKILHISPLSPYNVGWSYQENLLPKYQKKLGHEICLVVSPFENQKNGKVDVGENDFYLEDGIHVIRKRRFLGNSIIGKIISYTNVKKIIYNYQPDFIMVHSPITLSIFDAIKYKKRINKKCIIIVDNHLDENNAKRKNKIFTDVFYKYWKFINKHCIKYVSKYYGVTSWRKDFLINRIGVPENKTDVLIMGADLDNIDLSKKEEYRKQLEKKYNLHKQFIIVTGGKIDKNKKVTDLMNAVKDMKNVKLLVFGTISDDYKYKFKESENNNTIFLGWLNNESINRLFLSADLAVFPGGHSVLWEQACACKIPCLFASWPGINHLNNGGNSDFLENVNSEGLEKKLKEFINSKEYKEMLKIAKSSKTDIYSYEKIARKSIECVGDDIR